MFKLPICPHCHTVYDYKEVKSLTQSKSAEQTCYNCKKTFFVKKTKLIILALITVVVMSLINIFDLCVINNINFFRLMAINVVVIVIAILLYPYFISFKAINNKNSKRK